MKKIFLLGTLLISAVSFSQTFTWVAGTTMTEDLAENSTVQLKIEQEAVSDSVDLAIRVVEKTIPNGWDGMLCVHGLCFGTIRPVGFEGQMLRIGGDTKGYVRLTVNPLSDNQFARYGIYVYDVNFPNDGDTAVWILNPTLGVSEMITESNVGVYPNPAKDQIQIETTTQVNSYQIVDLNGKIILNSNDTFNNTSVVDISTLSTGIYNLIIKLNNGDLVQEKIVVE